jgi:hypothetical protein
MAFIQNAAREALRMHQLGLRPHAFPYDFIGKLGNSTPADWKMLQDLQSQANQVSLPDLPHTNTKEVGKLSGFSSSATLPAWIARPICAVLYADYNCLSFPLPSQCTDSRGRYNVTMHEVQQFCHKSMD